MEEVPHKARDKCIEWEKKVDALLADPLIIVEQALAKAVHDKQIPPEEAQDYLNAYIETFMPDSQ